MPNQGDPPPFRRPPVRISPAEALAAKREWDRAFAALAALRATPGLPAEIAALADDEERAKRREQAAEARPGIDPDSSQECRSADFPIVF